MKKYDVTYNYILDNIILYSTVSKAEYFYMLKYVRNLPDDIYKKYKPRVVLGCLPKGAIEKSYHSCSSLIPRLHLTIKITNDIKDDRIRRRVILKSFMGGVE